MEKQNNKKLRRNKCKLCGNKTHCALFCKQCLSTENRKKNFQQRLMVIVELDKIRVKQNPYWNRDHSIIKEVINQ